MSYYYSCMLTGSLYYCISTSNSSASCNRMVVPLADYVDELIGKGITVAPPMTAPPLPDNETEPVKDKNDEDNPFSCDHSIKLYILNQKYFLEAAGASPTVQKDEAGECWPAYWASYIPKTNLVLVVVENNHDIAAKCTIPPSTKPTPTNQSTSSREPCHKLELGALHRRRLEGCYTYHDGVCDHDHTFVES